MDESSMIKHPSGSSGSSLTDGCSDGATETEAGGEVCLDSEHCNPNIDKIVAAGTSSSIPY
jgi:hypothetical protein